MKRDSMVFYRSFADGIEDLELKTELPYAKVAIRKCIKMKNSFVLYTDYLSHIELLTLEQRGALLTAIMYYASGMELPDMDGMTEMAFSFIRAQMDKDNEKYEKIVESRREAGKKGGRPPEEKANAFSEKQNKSKKANGFSEKQTKAKKPDNDNVDVNVNDRKENSLSGVKEKRFAPPTPDEVQEYAKQNGYDVGADRFVNFYESKGWMIGKNRMKDWRAAVRNWARSERQGMAADAQRQGMAAKPSINRFRNFEEHGYDYESISNQIGLNV